MAVNIREAVASDAERIADMQLRYVDCPWTPDQVREEINDPAALFYVACDGDVVGFLSGVCAADECEISDIAVEDAYRRQGIATRLFDRLIAAAAGRGARCAYLLVRQDNAPAIGLYQSIGFTKAGVRKGYYGSADAVIMRRVI